ncbi:MAG: trypsin-like peptidase domain-containing protein [Planctomycetota bacterium]|jgi:hypothetical protein|nr:trypsin-like peptidase domain-containing protein [Planctomycetota bacterium]
MARPTRTLLWLLPALVLAGVAWGWGAFSSRLGELEALPAETAGAFEALCARLRELEVELEAARARLEHSERRGAAEREQAERMDRLEADLRSAGDGLALHGQRFERWKAHHEQQLTVGLGTRLEMLTHQAEERWSDLMGEVHQARRLAVLNRERIVELDRQGDRRPQQMWSELVGPTVQLSGETTVGTGVLLASVLDETSDLWTTPVITAWHVVRDILHDSREDDPSIPVRIYAADGSVRDESASLLGFDRWVDIALLELSTDEPCAHTARLADRERLAAVATFDPIYAVGCPLGNDPIPTFGEVADRRHEVDGERYWMISAPTYIGNSGGGIFDARTHELLAVFSKIYTHGSLQPTVVPHMGLATPLDVIYDWLAAEGLARIEPAEERGAPLTASATLDGPPERD